MMNLLKALRQDEYGVILSAEIVIIGSLLGIGLITGLTCLQKSVNGELQDLAGAIGALDQSYSFSPHQKSGYAGQCCAYTAGSAFNNCEQNNDRSGDMLGCEAACAVQATACGNCGRCNHCVGGPEGDTVCGTCGGRAGGCTSCGSGLISGNGRLSGNGPRCVDTGVPKMKVTEWPSSDCPVESGEHSHFGPIHESDVINQSVPMIEQRFSPLEQIGPQGLPYQLPYQLPNQQPYPSFESLPIPIPEGPQVPAIPMPSTTWHQRGTPHFVFPSNVW